jgi:hypothetical protein
LGGRDELLGAGEIEKRVGVVVGKQLSDAKVKERSAGTRELLGQLRESLCGKGVVVALVGVEGGSELLGGGL